MDAKGLETLLAVALVAALAPIVGGRSARPQDPAGRGADLRRAADRPARTRACRRPRASSCCPISGSASCSCWPATNSIRGCSASAPAGWPWSAGPPAPCSPSAPSAVLASFNYVHDFVPIGLALTTTALGTLLPILQDNNMLGGKFGRYVLAAGAVGELFPIVAISLFLTKRSSTSPWRPCWPSSPAALLLTLAPQVPRRAAHEGPDRAGQARHRADHAALGDRPAAAAAGRGRAVRTRCGTRSDAGRHGAAELDPPDGG